MDFGLFLIGGLLTASVVAGLLAERVGAPMLLLFLGVGMLAGVDGPGGIAFDSPGIANWIGEVALTVILFSGGLDTSWRRVRPVLTRGLLLATLGVLLTTLLLGGFAWWVLGTFESYEIGAAGISWPEALLLAAIVSSTDAPAVFSVFHSTGVRLKGDLQPLLELESGSNDPMAVILTVAMIGAIGSGAFDVVGLVRSVLVQLVVGAAVGLALGQLAASLIGRIRSGATGLVPVAAVAAAFLIAGVTPELGGSGFLAVYVAGVIVGNRLRDHREEIVRFHDSLSWLAQIVMFLTLGLLVNPSELPRFALVGTGIALFLMLVARPLSVTACLTPFRTDRRSMAFVSWVGLRGSVPIILATYPEIAGLAGAADVFHLVFFVVLVSVLIQGLTLVPCARWLKVSA